jgi:hypothetical protein
MSGKEAKRMGKPSPGEARGPQYPERLKVVGKKSEVEVPLRRWGYRYEYCFRWWDKGNEDWRKEERWFESEKARDQSLKVFEKRISAWLWYRNPVRISK